MTVLGRARDLLLAAGTIYLFPLAILAIFIPIAFLIKGVLFVAAWAWTAVL